MDGNGSGDIYMWHDSSEQKNIFLDEVASSKLNLHGGLFRKCGHLGLFEATPTCHSLAS